MVLISVGFQVSQLRAMVEAFFANGHELYRGYVQVGLGHSINYQKDDIYKTS